MNSLQMELIIMELSYFDIMDSLVKHRLHTVFVHVVLFFNGPLSIVLVQAVLVEINLFVKVKLLHEKTGGEGSGASIVVEAFNECLPGTYNNSTEKHV